MAELKIITNVLSNAIKFCLTGEVVGVKLDEFGTFVSISVYDKGPEILDEFKTYIFNKFSQVNIKTNSTGIGFEPSINNTIVETHRGSIHFDTKIDLGITFYVELPIKQTRVY